MLNQNIFAQLFPHMARKSGMVPGTVAPPTDDGTGPAGNQPTPTFASNVAPVNLPTNAAPSSDVVAANMPQNIEQLQQIGEAAKTGQAYDPQDPITQLGQIGEAAKAGRAYQYQDPSVDADMFSGFSYPKQAQAAPEVKPPGLPGLQQNISTAMRPGYDQAGNESMAGPRDPRAGPEIDPNASPEERERANVEYLKETIRNPTNRDKGWKGLVKEIAENFLYGLSHTQPGMGWKEGLALGGVGAAGGFFNKTANEQRRAEAELPRAMQLLDYETQQTQKRGQIANNQNAIANRDIQTRLDIEKAVADRLDGRQKFALDKWKARPSYKRGEDPEIDALGLPDKVEKDEWDWKEIDQGGSKKIVLFNPRTKETQEFGDFAKSGKVEFSEEEFGIPTDKDIADQVTASVGKLPEGRRVRADVAAKLPAAYKRADGSFNEEQYWKDRADGDTDVSPTDIYENLPSDYEQRTAAERAKLRGAHLAMRRALTTLNAALKTTVPVSSAAVVPRERFRALFEKIVALPEQVRDAKLKEFYANLPNIRIQ